MNTQETSRVGVLMLAGKMADVPGCMASESTFPYPVRRYVVPGSAAPRTPDDARAMLPSYVAAARELEREGVSVITANCGLMALLQEPVADAVDVPVVLSSLVAVPTVARMIGSRRRVGILTFYPDAVGEENFAACGWSSSQFPVSVAGVAQHDSWCRFLETKQTGDGLYARLRGDMLAVIEEFLAREPDIGALVCECTMLPAVLHDVRPLVPVPIFDVLTVLDWAASGFHRPAAREAVGTHAD
jgi:phosphoribosylcarboxyaminoimidazole (NCAIR) mutase